MMARPRPQNYLLTGMSDLSVWKEDLIPIVGEGVMVQEMPEAFNRVLEAQEKWNAAKSK